MAMKVVAVMAAMVWLLLHIINDSCQGCWCRNLCSLGSEVAQYAAVHFPEFLKTVAAYGEGSLAVALENAFLGFDATLVTEDVKKQLSLLAANGEKTDKADDNDEESMLMFFYLLGLDFINVVSCYKFWYAYSGLVAFKSTVVMH